MTFSLFGDGVVLSRYRFRNPVRASAAQTGRPAFAGHDSFFVYYPHLRISARLF
jgi:hypothetical protein